MSTNRLIRWSGFSLILAGVLLILGNIIHPSSETPQTIIAMENRLISGHWLLTFFAVFFLLGLTGVYASHISQFGRLGLAAFVSLFFGTIFYAVSSDYGFNAPVLARLAPQSLAAINAYPPVMIMDGLFVLLLLVGFILFGITILRSGIFPKWSGIFIIIGWPIYMIASALALTVFALMWLVAILGAFLLSLGLGSVGYEVWADKGAANNQSMDLGIDR